jgi:triacylglycerol esterase/lipase EstA (alpha/beta hydrolase family)
VSMTKPIRTLVVGVMAVAAVWMPSVSLAASGPRMTVPAASLNRALSCPRSLHHLGRDPVLLVPGTAADPATTYAWNYERTLPRAGYRYCTVTLPDKSLADIQVSAQYVVAAIRTMAARSGRKVAVIGMSQGGLEPRWALRFWPDLRKKVSDYVGLATPQHGTTLVGALCASGCAAALWQMAPDSAFLAALNRGAEVLKGPDWTAIYSRTDDIVAPQTEPAPSSALAPAHGVRSTSIALQTICPADTSTHIGTLADATATALVFDALAHRGPASAARVGTGRCNDALAPGLDKQQVDDILANLLPKLLATTAAAPQLAAEPALASYARRR